MKLMSPSRQWLLITSIAFFLVLVVLLASAGRDGKPQQVTAAEPAPVQMMPVTLQDSYQREISLVGRVESANNALLGFELAGQLARIDVEEGQSVVAGQTLAQLDKARLQAQYQELLAALTRAQADETLAQVSLKRLQDLLAKRLESAQRVDEASARVEATVAAVAQAQAALARVEVELQKSELIAPFDGVVTARHIDAGTIVNVGTPVVELQQRDSLRIRVSVPPAQVRHLTPGNTYPFTRNGTDLNAQLVTLTERRQLSTQTHEALFQPIAEDNLISGELVGLRLSERVEARGSWVPLAALDSGVRGTWTLLVTSGEGVQQLQARAVTLLYTDGRKAFVSGALDNNDFVVVSGTQRLVNHQSVRATRVAAVLQEE